MGQPHITFQTPKKRLNKLGEYVKMTPGLFYD